MVSQFSGIKYKLESSDKFDEYMKAIGVGLIARKVGNSLKPVVELVDNGDGTFSLKSSSTAKNSIVTFRLGEEFTQETLDGRKVPTLVTQETLDGRKVPTLVTQETLDGRKVPTLVTQEGDKLVEVQKGDKPSTIVREFTQDTLKMTLTIGDVVCTRVYKHTS